MYEIIETLEQCQRDSQFIRFENNLVKQVYEKIGTCYSNSENEVKLVTSLCDIIDTQQYDYQYYDIIDEKTVKVKMSYHAKKLHGSRSYVEFNNKDKPTTKELADMVVISVATYKGEIVLERTALIQNKKESDIGVWDIDQDQLFLLQNFPTFKGNRGLFKGRELSLSNCSQTLGNYGLFMYPGEMVLANALTIYRMQVGNRVSLSDINKYSNDHPYYLYDARFSPIMNYCYFSSQAISHNYYDFIRNWTSFKIGEIVSFDGDSFNNDLCAFNNLIYKQLNLFDIVRKRHNEKDYEIDELDANCAMMVFHMELFDKER